MFHKETQFNVICISNHFLSIVLYVFSKLIVKFTNKYFIYKKKLKNNNNIETNYLFVYVLFYIFQGEVFNLASVDIDKTTVTNWIASIVKGNVEPSSMYREFTQTDLILNHVFLAHLSQSDWVSFCDHFSSGVRPSVVRPSIVRP
jgi:hypothetical protein